ncbi:MAG: hypothetical protein DRJ61_18830 [Acidobacteria bacterium]|nr:MAG: hypothetical protein DRJ61_18830 [Acidobacteriota bacterium]
MKSDLPERTFEFARRIVRLCRHLDVQPGVSRTLANQLLRSGTFVGANVEEGQKMTSDFNAGCGKIRGGWMVSSRIVQVRWSQRTPLLSNFTLQTSNFSLHPSHFKHV